MRFLQLNQNIGNNMLMPKYFLYPKNYWSVR